MLSNKPKEVNIPRYVDDLFYRYKMPPLKAKVEGRGNGIKTVIENMSAIGEALSRPPSYMTKYFGFELGTQTICDAKNDRWIVSGKHEEEDLAKLLDDFIDRYVLCGKCSNPETVILIAKNNIELKCSACSGITSVVKHRLNTYIQKFPPSTETEYDQQASAQSQFVEEDEGMGTVDDIDIGVDGVVPENYDDDDDEWKADFSEAAVEQRRRELLGNSSTTVFADDDGSEKPEKKLDDPMVELASFLKENLESDDIEILKKIKLMSEKNGWSNSRIIQNVFSCLFSESMLQNLPEKCHVLSLVVQTPKDQQIVLFLFEKLCESDETIIPKVSAVLNAFYDEDVVEEETILKWYNHPTKRINAKVGKSVRKHAEQFVDWLQNASFSE